MITRALMVVPVTGKRLVGEFDQAIAFQRRSRVFAQAAAAWVFALGGSALIGWSLKSEMLKSIVPGSSPLKPNIAAGMLLCGAALALLAQEKVEKWLRSAIGAVAVAVILVALATLGEHFFDWNLGIDRWFVRDFPASRGVANPGRMMPTTAFCFVLLGTALLAEAQLIPRRFRFPLAAGLSAALVIIGVLALGGFSLEKLVGPQWNLMGMSLSGVTASAGFMILGSGLLALIQSKGALTWSLNALTSAGFAAGILLTTLTAASAFTFGKEMLEANTLISQRHEVLKKIQEVMTDVTDLASRERLYIITGNDQLLKEREQTKAQVSQNFLDVRKLTSGNPSQQRRLDQLARLIAQRIDWENQMIALRRGAGFAETAARVATGPGISLSDDILRVLKEMEGEEHGLLDSDRKQAVMASTATFLLLPLGVFVSVGVLSLSLFFLNAGVSEQKRAEVALRESEGRYRTLFESNPSPMWVFAVESLSFLAVNDAAVRHYAYSRDEFLAMTIKDIRPPEDVPALMDDLSQTTKGLGDTTQWRHRKKNGELIDVEITSHEVPWLGQRAALVLINDITERKRSDEVRAQLAAIVESSDDAIVSKTLGGVIASWNLGAERLFGYSALEAIGQPMLMLFPRDRVTEEANILARIRQGEAVDHFDTVRVRKDGKEIDVSVALSPIRDDRGRVIAASKIARDITERKQAENEIRALNAELEERVQRRTAELETANKELEAFSYSVSHDLRSPLRTIDGFSQAALEDFGPRLPEEGRRQLQTIRDGAQRMGVLIDDLLAFSRLSRLPLQKEEVDMSKMVRATFEELGADKTGRSVEINVGDLATVHGDPALLKQVWVNLLANALKYTRKRANAVIEVGCNHENGAEVFFVSDNGTGFDMQYAHKLFGVFQRLHRAEDFEGTGVGLAIVQRVIHRHGGRVWAEGVEGRGATFHFTLQENNKV